MEGKHLCCWCFSGLLVASENYCSGDCEVAYLWDKGDEASARAAAERQNLEWRYAMKRVFGAKWMCRFCGSKPVKQRGDVCSHESECAA